MKVFCKSDVGLIREHNEDFVISGTLEDCTVWVCVCDGMGGVHGGSIASATAAEIIKERITSDYKPTMNSNSIRNLLHVAVKAANIAVFEKAADDTLLHGMGTTVVAAIIKDGVIHLINVGDSRAYFIGKESITQITKDHSVVQQMIDSGKLTAEEARNDHRKNIITRAVGVDDDVDADYFEEETSGNSILILCSDGLTNFIDDEDILELSRENEGESFVNKLVETANKNGGGDNITIVAVYFD